MSVTAAPASGVPPTVTVAWIDPTGSVSVTFVVAPER